MQKQSILTISFLLSVIFLATACSGRKNPQPNDQQQHPSSAQTREALSTNTQSATDPTQAKNRTQSAIPSQKATAQSDDNDKAKGTFTFQINGKKYTATTVNPSIYEQVSDTSSVLGMIATYKKPDHSAVVISLNLQLKKDGLKPGTYTLGDAKIDKTPYKGIYMKKTSEGLMYYGYSKKGTVTITDHHKVQGSDHTMDLGDQKVTNGEGKISGHFNFTGKVVLTTTMANNPPEKPFTAKGTFHNISLRETRSSAHK